MIPGKNFETLPEMETEIQPSRTYRMDTETGVITGFCDGLEAVRQAVYKILNTERYEHLIYSWDYGSELRDVFGHSRSYACSEIQDAIEEALRQDDRITDVTDFVFDFPASDAVAVKFTVNSIYGLLTVERAVEVNV